MSFLLKYSWLFMLSYHSCWRWAIFDKGWTNVLVLRQLPCNVRRNWYFNTQLNHGYTLLSKKIPFRYFVSYKIIITPYKTHVNVIIFLPIYTNYKFLVLYSFTWISIGKTQSSFMGRVMVNITFNWHLKSRTKTSFSPPQTILLHADIV